MSEQIRYYEELEEMFATPGWRNLVKEASDQLTEWKELMPQLRSWDQVNELRGQMLQLARLLNLEEVTAMMKRQAEEELVDVTDTADADL